MAELLRDNLEASRHGELQEPTSSASESKRSRREVPDLLSWVQCFSTYLAVVATQHPERVKQLLAYQTLIVCEGRHCGGKGWLAYDSMFRQQAAGHLEVDWSKLNSSLYAVTFLAQAGSGKSCVLCLESDHKEDECTLAKARCTPAAVKSTTGQPETPRGGSDTARYQEGRARQMCFAWNQGKCSYPYCHYGHHCIRCGGDHRFIHCRSLDRESGRGRDRDRGSQPATGEPSSRP